MKYLKNLSKYVFAGLLTLAVFPTFAYAYLDPGTGSYVFQVLVGVLLGGVFAIKMFWRNIRDFISNLFSKESTED